MEDKQNPDDLSASESDDAAAETIQNWTDDPQTYAQVIEEWEPLFKQFPKLRLPKVNDDLYYFDPLTAEEKIYFFEEQIHHVEGPLAERKEKLILEPWQRYVIAMTYGWKMKTFDENGEWIQTSEQLENDLRKFREVLIFIPRKNGKSFMGGGFGLEGTFADNETGARVVSAAGDREQAALIFDVAKRIVEENDTFLEIAEPYRQSIIVASTNSSYKVVSADAKRKHGRNLSRVIVDELHVLPNRDLVDALFTSCGARLQPLKIMLTTAGHDKNSICWEYYDYAKKILSGVLVNEKFLPIIFEPDEGDDWKDKSTWLKANPNLGISITWDYFLEEFQKALDKPSYENTFKRLHLNIWTQQEVRWVAVEEWEACNKTFDPKTLLGRECWGGVDLASKIDITAYALVFPFPEEQMLRLLAWFWVPRDNFQIRKTRDRVDYEVWERQGYIIGTPGKVADYAMIRETIQETRELYRIKSVGFDEWNAQDTMTTLEKDGLNVVVVPQRFKYLSNATKEIEARTISRRIEHNNNPVLRWMFSNLAVIEDAEGNVRFTKEKATEKIDGMCAVANAMSRYLMDEQEPDSVYKSRGVRVIG